MVNTPLCMPHGGDVYSLERVLGVSKDSIVDLSTSVNPLPLPSRLKRALIKKIDSINSYPDPYCRVFKETLFEVYSIPCENVLCGNGSTELIYLFVQALSPKNVLILEPTFSEYERACSLNKATIHRVFSLDQETLLKKAIEKLSHKKIDLVFICNPNNPTGWVIKKEELLRLGRTFSSTLFIVDEAFIDFVESETLLEESIKTENLIVIRSLTKFYGLSGLRFGYAVASKRLIQRAEKFLIPWNVNVFAQTIASMLLTDKEFKDRTLNFFLKEKKEFEKRLKRQSAVSFFPSVANFYLLKLPRGGFFEYCLNHRILIRNCANFYGLDETFLRISVKLRSWNRMFFHVLESWLKA